MRWLLWALLLCGIVCISQSRAQYNSFPPGVFTGRAALDAPSTSYTGPGDIVSGAIAYWGFRGYNAAYSGKAANICLPSGGACADMSIVSGNFNLTTISGSTCNNSTTICTVKTLYDQSGATDCNSGASVCDVTNATQANQPILVISAANGHACAQFTGSSSQQLSSATAPQVHSQPYTFIAFAKRTGAFTTAGTSMHSGAPSGFFDTSANNWGMYAGNTTLDATAADSAFHSLINVFNSTSSANVVDGSATVPGNNPGTNNLGATSDWFVGNDGSGDFLTGVWCEGGAWASGFNATQYGNMNTNQSNYF